MLCSLEPRRRLACSFFLGIGIEYSFHGSEAWCQATDLVFASADAVASGFVEMDEDGEGGLFIDLRLRVGAYAGR